ncbi:pyridoxal phosphate-dependent decarboxylase family protein [Rhizosaccharibacter radicis]|uniref:Pyridoxal-dependent decarboxylase n=1 Tax=Rhizosaccharibacter radicis TaxID=2782605 RepID=A0ABT1VYH5_9PROT|nr:pyridoxal-dependent decarboxylase [Acetobacteraceae bacterium KSS12]
MAGLDGESLESLRALGHRMLDDLFDRLEAQGRGEGPAWQPTPPDVRLALLDEPLPAAPADPSRLYDEIRERIVPYGINNTHPRFMGWVHGGGTAVGMLADMLSAGLNNNLGGRDHAPVLVERTVVRWAAEMLGMPPNSGGILVTGSSIANMIAVLTARRRAAGPAVRVDGVDKRLVGYAGATAHGCVARAFDMAGLGTAALRVIPCDDRHRLRADLLAVRVAEDRAAGLIPFIVVGTAGAVDTGAVDDLDALASFCAAEELWFHVDGAFGALAALSPRLHPLMAGLGRADSVAFDFHKWAQVPYDAGCVLVRDAPSQAAAFAQSLAYLSRADRGAAAGAPWPCDLGPDLSRGFRALKVWMTLRSFGTDGLGRMVDGCCAVASHLAARVEREPMLELMAPVPLNIVCFRVTVPGRPDLDDLNEELVKDLHESGIAVPSTTTVGGTRVIRAAIVNHRTGPEDADAMIDGLLALLDRRLAGARPLP